MELSETDNKELVQAKANQLLSGDGAPRVSRGVIDSSIGRQIGVFAGIALTVAIGVAVAMWSQTPDYGLLYASIDSKEMGEVLAALDALEVEYRVESSSGAILVPRNKVYQTRMQLSGQGIPRSDNIGFELLEKDLGFGVSQNMESARHQRALEGEIARSIMIFQSVKSARVHLGLPKQSVFIRKRKKPSASVLVDLYAGRYLEKGQVAAIIHMVASSVPELEAKQITVVDQRGNLLTEDQNDEGVSLSNKQFDYKKQIEEHLIRRVENILTPIVGSDAMRTQISADIDFTITEQTQEQFKPDPEALRSEQTEQQQSREFSIQGVPGALSNQPPAAGIAPEDATGSRTNDGGSGTAPFNSSASATRNFELDKTISHSKLASGITKRLTVAVVIDIPRKVAEDQGNKEADKGQSLVGLSYSEEELARFAELVKQAVGFDADRGDQVTVTSVAFKPPEEIEPVQELPIWQQSWFQPLVKQLIGLLVLLILIFSVLRPILKGLIARREPLTAEYEGANLAAAEGGDKSLADTGDKTADELLLLGSPQSYEKRLEFARKMVDDDPKRVAQVMKNWVNVNG